MIPPSDFIPIAEATGLIRELGVWVLNAACREAVSWAEPLRVAVNGNPPANTEVEVGVIVYDDMGNATNGGEPTIIAFVTPGGE